MEEQNIIRKAIHFSLKDKGRRLIREGPAPVRDTPKGRVPRISRLLALAIHFEHLIQSGGLYDQADVARFGHVTRARVTQIMNLLLLAPDIQEEILFLPAIAEGHDPIPERQVRFIASEVSWWTQRKLWQQFKARALGPSAAPHCP